MLLNEKTTCCILASSLGQREEAFLPANAKILGSKSQNSPALRCHRAFIIICMVHPLGTLCQLQVVDCLMVKTTLEMVFLKGRNFYLSTLGVLSHLNTYLSVFTVKAVFTGELCVCRT